MTVFARNLKRLRQAKKLTQEQAAQALGVSAQAVSRWECETTLPDVTLLPKISEVYCVSIDDLYRDTSVAYENHAQRLVSVYKSTWQPEDFARADQEFRKLRRSGTLTPEDLRHWGILHQYMLGYCIKNGQALFDEVLARDPQEIGETYWRTRRQKLYFLNLIGQGDEAVETQKKLIESGCGDVMEWISLLAACQYAGQNEAAYAWFCKAAERFPQEAMVYVYGGDICKELGRVEEAFRWWDKALALDAALCDAKHSKAFCYEELQQWDKAYETWKEIENDLRCKGFDVEAEMLRQRAERCEKYKK